MGAGSSALQRVLGRRSLAARLCPGLSRAKSTPAASSARDGGGVLVLPLENPPDVIEAHERYYYQHHHHQQHHLGHKAGGQPAERPNSDWSRGSGRPVQTSTQLVSGLLGLGREHADRTLPTQHHHPQQRQQRQRQQQEEGVRMTSAGRKVLRAAQRSRGRQGRRGRDHHNHHDHHHLRRDGHHQLRSRSRASSSRQPRHPVGTRPGAGAESAAASARRALGEALGAARACFGYDIEDVNGFLEKASLENPANIPMVLANQCTLYRTHEAGTQEEVGLPLGMVVNGVFRASCWLYAQTPHGNEGYVLYSSCLPLGILPQQEERPSSTASSTTSSLLEAVASVPGAGAPGGGRRRGRGACWDTASDIFPFPALGNRTDNDKTRDTRSERAYKPSPRRRGLITQGLVETKRAELSVDRLYLRATAAASALASRVSSRPRPLVVVQRQYRGLDLCLEKGDVIVILEGDEGDSSWLHVQDRHGRRGFVPAGIVDQGFL